MLRNFSLLMLVLPQQLGSYLVRVTVPRDKFNSSPSWCPRVLAGAAGAAHIALVGRSKSSQLEWKPSWGYDSIHTWPGAGAQWVNHYYSRAFSVSVISKVQKVTHAFAHSLCVPLSLICTSFFILWSNWTIWSVNAIGVQRSLKVLFCMAINFLRPQLPGSSCHMT